MILIIKMCLLFIGLEEIVSGYQGKMGQNFIMGPPGLLIMSSLRQVQARIKF